MLKWFKKLDGDDSGLAKIVREFELMLGEGRHVFDGAANAYLGAADAAVVREELVEADRRINHMEREIRRAIVVHATVYGVTEFPACLVLMSIAKDAERIGDESKNILDLATFRPKQPGTRYYDQLRAIKDRSSRILAETRLLYQSQDSDAAPDFIDRTEVLKDECDDAVEEILRGGGGASGLEPGDAAATALCFRYYKRVVSHARNIVTSIVVPVDRLDYFDESKDTRDDPPPI